VKLKKVLGIDIGGSGIKGAIVHTKKGKLLTERYRIPTPGKSTPENVAKVIKQIADHFNWEGPIGCGFPAVVQHGVARSAANIDDSWIGVNINELVTKETGCPTMAINDADAAGMAEMKFGAGKSHKGVVFLVTVGTGLGTVFFTRGKLLPNTELGHVLLNEQTAEEYASDAVRKRLDLTWEEWAVRFNEYLLYIEKLFSPDLFIIGGGASKKDDKYIDQFTVQAPIIPAKLLNQAGIVGAARAARIFFKENENI